jgi:AraC-like DNA-binding protein
MNYQTYTPHALLSKNVKCFWTLEADNSYALQKQRIIPDGCMEMIFHYGDHYLQFGTDGGSIIQPKCFVFGQVTVPLEIAPSGVTGIIAARFEPDGFIPFSRLTPDQMNDKAVPLTDFFEEEGEVFGQQVLEARNTEERIAIIESFLHAKLLLIRQRDELSRACVELLWQTVGQLSIEELGAKLMVNRRKLERRFSATIGLSPKQLTKIIRLQHALKAMKKNPPSSLTALAYENGYYDQAHFIKDFKEFTGISPKQFFTANHQLATLFIAEH